MLSCIQVSTLASQYLDDELSRGQRLSVRMHLTLCRYCRRFVKDLATTIKLTKNRSADLMTPRAQWLAETEDLLRQRLRSEQELEQPPQAFVELRRLQQNPSPRMAPVEHPQSERVRKIFEEIASAMGEVSGLFRTYAHNPDVLEANWNKVKAIMLNGKLSRKLKESIAIVVSQDNGCRFCVAYHSRALQALGVAQAEVERIRRDPLSASFDPKERALLALARQANRDPHGASDEQVLTARKTGATDAEIIEALGVMELFTGFNRFLDVLDVSASSA